MFNEPSLTVSLPPSRCCCLTPLLGPHPSSTSPHFILVCLSLFSCRRPDSTELYWFRMRCECWWWIIRRGGRRGGAERLFCTLLPFITPPLAGLDPDSATNHLLSLNFSYKAWVCAVYVASDRDVWGWQYLADWLDVNHMRKPHMNADPAPKCL